MDTRATLRRWLWALPSAALAAALAACSVVSSPSTQGFSWGGRDAAAGGAGSGGVSAGPGGASSGAGGGFADAGSCQPGDVSTWQPSSYHPANAPENACPSGGSVDLIAAFYDRCLGSSATAAACAGFRAAYPDCYACILSPDSANHYGPVLDHGAFVTANVAGCIELSDVGPQALACAKATQALATCERAACEVNCPVTDPKSLASYNACAAAVDTSGCEPFASGAACASQLLDGGEAGAAAGGGDAGGGGLSGCLAPVFKDFYEAVAPRFCSSGSAAMGADAGGGSPPGDAGLD